MSEYIIVTDSAGDLSAEMAKEMGVEVLPLSFTIRGTTLQNWPDHRDMPIREFYQLVRGGEMPTTSAVNVQQYVDLLTPALESGKDALILSFASALSATYQSSVLAAQELQEQFPERKIYVVDTKCASMGEGLLVWYAANKRKAGEDIDTVRDWCEENKGKFATWFTVNDLMHLKRGGRVSAATAVVGTMLQIKPVLNVNEEGKLDTVAKGRGRKASLDILVDRVKEKTAMPEGQTVFIAHGDCLEDAQYVGNALLEAGLATEVQYNFLGPVIGSHTGPGAVVMAFVATEK